MQLNYSKKNDFTERLESKVRNFDDFSREEVVKLIDEAKNSKWEARKIKGADKYSAQHHYEKHGAKVGARNMAEYNEKAVELFRNPKRELYVGLQRGKILLTGYYKGNFAMINLNSNEILTFHKRDEEDYIEKLEDFDNLIKLQSKGISKGVMGWIKKN